MLINLGNVESAQQQFGVLQDRMQESSDDDDETLPMLREVVDEKSGFRLPLDKSDAGSNG
ncbi:MAG: hypothetical protein R3F22_03495 [Lysobacteraceae bacterium]